MKFLSRLKLKILFLATFAFSFTPAPVLAATINNDPAELRDLETIFANLVAAAVGLAGLGLLFTIVSGGIKWATASGNPKKLQQAQHTIGFAVMGFILFVAATLFLRLVEQFTGVNITIFQIFEP